MLRSRTLVPGKEQEGKVWDVGRNSSTWLLKDKKKVNEIVSFIEYAKQKCSHF